MEALEAQPITDDLQYHSLICKAAHHADVWEELPSMEAMSALQAAGPMQSTHRTFESH